MPKSPSKPRKRAARTHFSIPEVGQMLGRHRSTIWRKKEKGQVRTERVLGVEMIPVEELIRLGILKEST